jgi:hypothetical protein
LIEWVREGGAGFGWLLAVSFFRRRRGTQRRDDDDDDDNGDKRRYERDKDRTVDAPPFIHSFIKCEGRCGVVAQEEARCHEKGETGTHREGEGEGYRSGPCWHHRLLVPEDAWPVSGILVPFWDASLRIYRTV